MWYPIEDIIKHHNLDSSTAKQLVESNGEQLGVHHGQLNSWDVDGFVAAVRAATPHEF